jgi:hypothetical protein
MAGDSPHDPPIPESPSTGRAIPQVPLPNSRIPKAAPDNRSGSEVGPASPKSIPRPHYVTIVLSSVAVALSLASLWQSNRTYNLSTRISKAAVQVSSAKLVERPEDATWLRYDLTLTNLGGAAARNIIVSSQFEVSQIDVPISDGLYEHPRMEDMAPKFTQTIRLQSNQRFTGHRDELTKGSKNKLMIFGTIEYTDDATGALGRDAWCFVYDPEDDEQSKTLELRRCEYQP